MAVEGSRSHFVRRRRFRPWRLLPASLGYENAQHHTLRLPRPEQRPARFAVGIGQVGASEADATIIPESFCRSAPQQPAVYLGRVEEVAENGEVTARVWEWPGGQESIATLTAEQLGHADTHPGAALRIWTWLELSGGPERPASTEPTSRIRVEVRNKELSEEERARIARLVEQLSADGEETP